jgi:hypothetical protein
MRYETQDMVCSILKTTTKHGAIKGNPNIISEYPICFVEKTYWESHKTKKFPTMPLANFWRLTN